MRHHTKETGNAESRERLIANLLWSGTLLASATIAIGLLLSLAKNHLGNDVMKIGIALFIVLPAMRVGLMLIIFLRERDYAYVAISALVLTIITAGFLAGL